MSKWDKDFLNCGFAIATEEVNDETSNQLKDMINAREALVDQFLNTSNQELVAGINSANTTILAFCKAYKIRVKKELAVDRINNLVTQKMQEIAMSTKKAPKKTAKQEEPKKAKPEASVKSKKTAKPEEPKKAKPEETKPETKPETPDKALSTDKTEASPEKSATIPPEPFCTPCGGLFDADPSSSCFGMCKDESPEDFEVCMNHFKSALEAKTTKRRAAATKTAKERVKREGSPKSHATKRYDRIGDGFGTSAHMINILLLEGATLEEIMDIVPTEKTRVTGHLSGLKSGNGKRKPKTIIKDPVTKRYYLEVEEGEPCTYFTII